MWGLLLLQLSVLLALAATCVEAVEVTPNEVKAQIQEEQQRAIEQAEFQKAIAQSKLASLSEQVAVAEKEELEVKADLDASKAHVKALRQQLSKNDLQRTIDEQNSKVQLWPDEVEVHAKEVALLEVEKGISFFQMPFAEEDALVGLSQEDAGRSLDNDGSLSMKLQQTKAKLLEAEKELAEEQDRREVSELLLHSRSARLEQDRQKLKLLQQLKKKLEQTAAKREKVLGETHRLLEDPLFAEASYNSPGVTEEKEEIVDVSKVSKEEMEQKEKAIGAAKEEAKMAKAKADKLQLELAKKKEKLDNLNTKAELGQKEAAELKKKTQHMEEDLKHTQELQHSDETKAALKVLKEKQHALEAKQEELSKAKAELQQLQNRTQHTKLQTQEEKAKADDLDAQMQKAAAEITEVRAQIAQLQKDRKALMQEQEVLSGLQVERQENMKLEQTLAEETVKLDASKKRLSLEQEWTKVHTEQNELTLAEEKHRTEAEVAAAKKELEEAKADAQAEEKEQEASAEKKFQEEQELRAKRFEEERKAAETKQRQVMAYSLAPLREEAKEAEEDLEAAKKQFKEDEEDARARISQLQENVEQSQRMLEAGKKEQEVSIHRMQNKYLAIQREAQKKLNASKVQYKTLQQGKKGQERRLAELQDKLQKAAARREQADRNLQEEEQQSQEQLQNYKEMIRKEQADYAKNLRQQKVKEASELKVAEEQLHASEDAAHQKMSEFQEQLALYDIKSKENLEEQSKKVGLLRGALSKDAAQIKAARSYFQKEMEAANLAEKKIEALTTNTTDAAYLNEERKVKEVVQNWKHELLSFMSE